MEGIEPIPKQPETTSVPIYKRILNMFWTTEPKQEQDMEMKEIKKGESQAFIEYEKNLNNILDDLKIKSKQAENFIDYVASESGNDTKIEKYTIQSKLINDKGDLTINANSKKFKEFSTKMIAIFGEDEPITFENENYKQYTKEMNKKINKYFSYDVDYKSDEAFEKQKEIVTEVYYLLKYFYNKGYNENFKFYYETEDGEDYIIFEDYREFKERVLIEEANNINQFYNEYMPDVLEKINNNMDIFKKEFEKELQTAFKKDYKQKTKVAIESAVEYVKSGSFRKEVIMPLLILIVGLLGTDFTKDIFKKIGITEDDSKKLNELLERLADKQDKEKPKKEYKEESKEKPKEQKIYNKNKMSINKNDLINKQNYLRYITSTKNKPRKK